jgi:hypothetical protein
MNSLIIILISTTIITTTIIIILLSLSLFSLLFIYLTIVYNQGLYYARHLYLDRFKCHCHYWYSLSGITICPLLSALPPYRARARTLACWATRTGVERGPVQPLLPKSLYLPRAHVRLCVEPNKFKHIMCAYMHTIILSEVAKLTYAGKARSERQSWGSGSAAENSVEGAGTRSAPAATALAERSVESAGCAGQM